MDELTQLALRARKGDRLALGSFIRKTQADVWRLCKHLGPAGGADDATQETYIRMMQALPGFRAEASARTWLLSIARNTATDALRSAKRRDRLHLKLLSQRAASEAPNHRHDTLALLDDLPPDQRAAFVLTQILGLSYEEAAQSCRCAVGTIRSRVARARASLVDAVTSADDLTHTGRTRTNPAAD